MNILVRLPNWMGDMIMSIPFLNALHEVYPDATVDLIIKKGYGELVDYFPNIRQVFVFSKTTYPGLHGCYRFGKSIPEQYDLFFCLPESFSSAFMGFFIKSKKRIGFQKEGRSLLLNHSVTKKIKDLHWAERYFQLLEKITNAGWTPTSTRLTFQENVPNPLPKGKNLILNINSQAPARRIPIFKAIEIINQVRKNYVINIILVGGPAETEYVGTLANAFPDAGFLFNFAGKTTIPELIAMLHYADAIITSDSGTAHLANAFGLKTIVLNGAGDENYTRPYHPEGVKIVRKPGLACAPCIANTCKLGENICMTQMDTRLIMNALSELEV